MKEFEKINIDKELYDLKKKSAFYWVKKNDDFVLKFFQFVYNNVPAYKNFLEEHNINYKDIRTINDFKKLPIITKDNYLRKYSYQDLFPRNGFFKSITYSATSGTSGNPFYFPREEVHDKKYELAARIYFEYQFQTKKKKTLVVLGFGLGIWIGGIMSYKILYNMALNGHKITIAPIGPNKELFLKVIKKLGHFYEQIILMGYPPFIKEIIDEGKNYGIKWGDYNIKVFTAAEGYSEEFKEYLVRKAKLKNKFTDLVNLYGTVEFGVMGHETALSSLIRHIASKNYKIFKELFPNATTIPTFVQYYPQFMYFEEIDGNIIASGYGSSIPLLRYFLPDLGGVINFEDVISKLKQHNINIKQEMKKYNIKMPIFPLPFVYVYTRSDLAVSFYGIVLYPEYFKPALQDRKLEKYVTGKFTAVVTYDKEQNQYLEINVELQKNVKPPERLVEMVKEEVLRSLLKNSTEYNHLYSNANPEYKKQLEPKIILWPYEHEKYFSLKGKHKWSIKQI